MLSSVPAVQSELICVPFERMARRKPALEQSVVRSIPKGEKILVACSGGKDSITLLHVLLSTQRLHRCALFVAHVDHGLRRESRADARFVESLAHDASLPYFGRRLADKPNGANTESWGREARYAFFATLLKKHQIDWIATAHTLNDVAETLLMKLCANKATSTIAQSDSRRRCVRPMLDVSRAEVEAYVARNSLTWREDASNADTLLTRNRVRHALIPTIATLFGDSTVRSLAERAKSLGQDEACLSAVAAVAIRPLMPIRWNDVGWLAEARIAVEDAHPAIRWRMLEGLFLPILGYPLGERRATPLVELVRGNARTSAIGDGRAVVRGRTGLTLVGAE